MPANRSRTENWMDCLRKINERQGALEIAVSRGTTETTEELPADLVWRVRVLEVHSDRIVVEPPGALGHSIPIRAGTRLIGAMTIGQNRWMFHTRALNTVGAQDSGRHQPALTLELPVEVERCTRRNFYRISTADLNLPRVRCWPLLDPMSAVAAEIANRVQIDALLSSGGVSQDDAESLMLPIVGPEFPAELVNIGAGGLGLRVSKDFSAAVGSRPHLWLRLNLTPGIPSPLAVTVRVAHTHFDSTQMMYVGLAFEFGFNAEHRDFVSTLLRRYAERVQSMQRIAA